MSCDKFDRPVLVVVDHLGDEENGYTLTAASEHLLKVAGTLTNNEVIALVLNASPQMEKLSACGVSRVVVPELAGRSPRVSSVVADAVIAAERALAQNPLGAILCLSNYRGREVAAFLGAHFRSGAATDVTDVSVVDGAISAHKSVLGGQWKTAFTIPSGLPIVAMRPGAGEAAEPTPVATPGIIPVNVNFSAPSDAVEVMELEELKEHGPALTEAGTVVCVGYGTDGEIEDAQALADRLNGAIGATRAVCDEGWVERSRQIGQTGVSVAPNLYIGVGVSGAIHHTCGISGAQKIVVINEDEEAPLVKLADLAVIGDCHEVLAEVLTELEQS
ncbi:hypothetical protein BSR29_06300 [Boudabousia liubingyangii]|uniref:Electron transfer flavoprotein alpha/beta-subunit N-terminal domain-containing protein n=1 Tax=Boudabousia liubingyangii TaxID=1921764 RepID=A0A1Q5PKR2_9ACTO|nr:electron transfer flavoprotein subunit alpha/FixB family protein [Boudabousia liubingyangii]OKL46452.1 hypothetical protein BSR28_07980 [Boudabousia liubingyangii]OKL47225.1 hypothetical protein BSR29_06300 [Boudabousia liubingyangii]